MPRNWRTRSHLTFPAKDLKHFEMWLVARGYRHRPTSPKATYEVLRMRKYNRQGDEPDLVVYRNDGKKYTDRGMLRIDDDGLGIARQYVFKSLP